MTSTKFDLIIRHGRVLTLGATGSTQGTIVETQTDIGILNGKIAHLGSLQPDQGEQIMNAQGLTVLPGLIDTQVHFRDPGLTHKEDLESGTKAAAMGGITGVFEMPNTNPATVDQESLQEKILRFQTKGWVHGAFYVGANGSNSSQLGQLEKLPGCCGVKVFMGSSTGNLLVESDDALKDILKNTHRRVAIHSEDEARLRERKELALKGKHARFHPLWRDEESALLSTKRIVNLAKQLNRKLHILHVSTAQELEFLSAHKNRVTIEVLANHLSLAAPDCYERLGTLAQQNPPIRDEGHQKALWLALQKGLIDVIASDHAPHTLEEKSRQYPESPSGTPGVQTLVPIMLNHVNQGRLPLAQLVKLMCLNPIEIFGLKNKGCIEVGCDADLTIIDMKKENRIENNWIVSKSQWTPFDGMKVKGWPMATVIKGKFAMREGQLASQNFGELFEFKDEENVNR